eukprot:gnl/MRDRNA2_/MRDRNA2_88121_c0_seq1.p1 gnl/MRDRNA2_/MRDRNA2_88121_c0~~gnl/MRDRNA2_/MRDRNA2_88121_c0_seq1.p1  ORF type:complete len:430 (+),score=112.17 gnl/MRDRNA2_/MRDRNA2_88121_c0_seq1:99-1388(+)
MMQRICISLLLISTADCQEVLEESCALSEACEGIPQAEENPSLLAHRVSFRKAVSFANQQSAHQAWREKQTQLEREVNESQSVLDEFIEEQNAAGDACSSRLMESKRTLDGLLHDLRDLSIETSSHEKILETETENLNITFLSIEAVDTETKIGIEKCKKEREEAIKEVTQYTAELEELIQIAQPSVRYRHAKPGMEKKDMVKLDKLALSSLGTEIVEKSDFSEDSCLAFIDFAKHHDYNLRIHMRNKQKPDARACDLQREELQKAYTKAFLEVKDLLKDAKDRVLDDSCFESYHAKKAAEMVPLVAARDQSAGRIEYSAAALAATEPVLHLVTDRTEQLRDHIKQTLAPECKEAGEVTEMLEKVRELIISLSECPGRDDFRLKIPEEEKKPLLKDDEDLNDSEDLLDAERNPLVSDKAHLEHNLAIED